MPIVRRPRVDRIRVRLDKDKSKRIYDARGYLNVWGTVVSADQRLEYNEVDGAPRDGWVEYVPESTVFNEGALDTLRHAPITLHHPPEMLDTKNTSRYQVGSVIELKRDGKKLRALHQITDERALVEIDNGVFELSPGYIADIDETPGEVGGVHHDAVQVARVYNHHSIVPDARAGHGNSLDKLDCISQVFHMDGLSISRPQQQRREDNTMGDETEKVDYELGDETFSLPQAIVDRLTSLEAKVAGKNSDAEEDEEESSEGDDDEEDKEDKEDEDDEEDKDSKKSDKTDRKGKNKGSLTRDDIPQIVSLVTESVTKSHVKAEAKRDRIAKQRADVIADARPHLPQSYNFDGKSTSTIMFDAVVAVNPDHKAKAQQYRKDAGVLRGMFVMLRDPKRNDAAPIGGDGQNHNMPTQRWVMDKAIERRDKRVQKTQASFRRLGKIGQQLCDHVADTFGDEAEKTG